MKWVRCTREEAAGGLPQEAKSGAYVHRLGGSCKCGSVHENGIARNHTIASAYRKAKKTRYAIVNEAGQLEAAHVRRDFEDGEKSFHWEQANGKNGLAGRPVASLPLYNLPKLIAAAPDAAVLVVEGEKTSDALTRVGIHSVATITGAEGTPQDQVLRPLIGHFIYLWPDNDIVGRAHMDRLAQALVRLGAKPRLIQWLEAREEGDDAADFLARGGTPEGIRALMDGSKPWKPTAMPDAAPMPEAEIAEHLTDLGNMQRFVRLQGKDLRYVGPWKKWLLWNGKHWELDSGCKVLRYFDAVIKDLITTEGRIRSKSAAIKTEIVGLGGPPIISDGNGEAAEKTAEVKRLSEQARAYRDWARKSEFRARIEAGVSLARARSEIEVRLENLDQDPWALNVLNGTIDLRTGELRPHRREDLITKLCPVLYDPQATAPTWERFLSEVMDGKELLVAYLHRVLGYSITADVREQLLWFLYGEGANGKSTLLGALRDTLGDDYAIEAMPELLMEKKGESHPTERAQLFGKRFVSTVEIADGRRMAEVMVKRLTGGDAIDARRMREDPWNFKPTHKLFLAANHKPEIRGTDRAIWRRIRLIPFTVSFEGRADKGLPGKLAAERPGILAWLVRGAIEWDTKGLQDPAEVIAATENYRNEMDPLKDFLTECCVTGVPQYRVRARELYRAFLRFAEEVGVPSMTEKAFSARLTMQGFEKTETSEGRWRIGIGLKSSDQTQDPQ